MMNRERNGLLNKLSAISQETDNDESKDKTKRKMNDPFHELNSRIGERLHHLKVTLHDDNGVAMTKRGNRLRETIRRQQEIRDEIRLAGIDLENLTARYDRDMKRKRKKFSPQELAMRKEIVTQYRTEYERINALAAANYRSPAGGPAFDTASVTVPIDSFDNGAFTPRTTSGEVGESSFFSSLDGAGGDGGPFEREVVADDQYAVLADIQKNDERFDNIIEQIGTGVQELGMQARMLNKELQQQTIMIDGLGDRIDTTQAHVKSVNRKMKDTLLKVGRRPNKCCMKMICLILLLGILAMIYKMIVEKNQK